MPTDADFYGKGDEIGKYTVLSKIGGSGMAEVYEVEDESGNLYACKVYSPKAVPSYVKIEKIRTTLIDQVPDVQGLVRPNEVIEADGHRIVISDYIQGSSLRGILDGFFNHEKTLDPPLVASIADKILATLAAFPPLTVHGLIKPSNVILQGAIPEGPIKEDIKIFIIALGESRLLSFSKFASIQLSHGRDYYYMAPEYISLGGRVTSAADIYSVGVMMYEAVTGEVPKKNPAPVAEVVESIDPSIAEIIDRAISKKPESRFQEVGGMRDAIRTAIPNLAEYVLPSTDEIIETIEEEDIFIISDEDAKLADDVDDIDVFSEVEAVSLDDVDELKDSGEPEQEDDLFEVDATIEAEEPEEVEDLFALDADVEEAVEEEIPEDLFAETVEEEPTEEEVPFEEEPVEEEPPIEEEPELAEPVEDELIEEEIDLFVEDEGETEEELEQEPVEESVEEPEEVPIDMAPPVEEEASEAEAEFADEKPEEDIEEEPEPEEEVEAQKPEEPPVEKEPEQPAEPPRMPPKVEKPGFPWGTIFVVGIVALLIGLVVWKYYSLKPTEEETATPTPVVEQTVTPEATPDSAKTPEATPDKKQTPKPTPTPTPTPTPEPTPEPTPTPDPKEAKIKALILAGEKQKKKKHYVSPKKNNLLGTATEIESLQPDHPWAKETRSLMVADFISMTESEITKKQYSNAESFANDGLKVDSKNKKLKDLLAQIQKEKNKPKEKACVDGMSLVWGGTLRMGSSPDDPMRRPGERSNEPIYVSSFCVDRFEYPNKGGAAPKIKVSWYEAKAACESQGKRLCKEEEWERACKGPENYRYPYGNDFNDTSCNTADKEGVGRKLNVTGSKKNCRSKFGVYDMSGNVREWTASRIAPGNPAYVVKGGSAIRPDWAARCAIREFAMPGQTSSLIGFRCCSDAKKTE